MILVSLRAMKVLWITCCIACVALWFYSFTHELRCYKMNPRFEINLARGRVTFTVMTRRFEVTWRDSVTEDWAFTNDSIYFASAIRSYGLTFALGLRWVDYQVTQIGWTLAIPLWIPTIVSIVFAIASLMGCRLFPRPRKGHCAFCGYNLTGNTSRKCPECGKPATSQSSQQFRRVHP